MREDEFAWPLLVALADCLCQEIETSELPDVCFCSVLPGPEPPLDYCHKGQAWVRLVQEFPSAQFPLPDEQATCDSPLAAQIEVGISRCAPQGKSATVPPTAEQQFEATRLQMADKAAMRRAIQCCASDREHVLGFYTPSEVTGDCISGTWLVTFSEFGS